MAVFDCRNLDSAEAAQTMKDARDMATYTNGARNFGLPTDVILNALGDNEFAADKTRIAVPEGWVELSAPDLGLPASAVDDLGYFVVESPLTGNAVPNAGEQAKVFARLDESGRVDRLCLSWCGTNDPVDVVDYFQLNEGTIAPKLEPLLDAVRDYALAQGLNGDDVIITGYSLGGALVNVTAKYREELSDGFYRDALYYGIDSPLIYDEEGAVINLGFENDVVYRILGDEDDFSAAVAAADPGWVNPDKNFASGTDNIVLFDDVYASPLWDASPFSILNIPFGWAAHVGGITTGAVARIADSAFFEYTARDSVIVVSNLSAGNRALLWVEDKAASTSDHYGSPAFVIGTQYADKLKGGEGGDYLDGGAGDDKFKAGDGVDRIAGGAGEDTLILEGRADDWSFYRLGDEVFALSRDGHDAVQMSEVERLAFADSARSLPRPYTLEDEAIVDHGFLPAWRNRNIEYGDAVTGGDGDDILRGETVFAGAGDDVLYAQGHAILHGGEGDDSLFGDAGGTLIGAEGDDLLSSGGGAGLLYGGVGNDVFVIDSAASEVVIKDFDSYAGDRDLICFAPEFSSDPMSAARSVGEDVLFEFDCGVTVTVCRTSLEQLQNAVFTL